MPSLYDTFWAERREAHAIEFAMRQPLDVAVLAVQMRPVARPVLADAIVRRAYVARIHADTALTSRPVEPAGMDRGS